MAKRTVSGAAQRVPDHDATARQIVADWLEACKGGLNGKRLDGAVRTKFEPRFQAKVASKLRAGEKFDAAATRNSRTDAKDVGRVCAMMTDGATVSVDTFEEVFRLLKRHATCPRAGTSAGAGVWCDVPII